MVSDMHNKPQLAILLRPDIYVVVAVVDLDINIVLSSKSSNLHVVPVSAGFRHAVQVDLVIASDLLRRWQSIVESMRVTTCGPSLGIPTLPATFKDWDKRHIFVRFYSHMIDDSGTDLLIAVLMTKHLVREGIE